MESHLVFDVLTLKMLLSRQLNMSCNSVER